VFLFKKFGFSGNSDFFKNLGDRVGKGLFISCAAIGSVILTVGGAYAGSYDFCTNWEANTGSSRRAWLVLFNPISALFYGAALLLFGAMGTYKDQNRQKQDMQKLSEDNEQLNDTKNALNSAQEELQESKSRMIGLHGELVQTWLKSMSKFLELDSNSRVTIYFEHDDAFHLLERNSKNPTYSKVHRQKFPLNQGVISKAWEHGSHIEEKCPHSSSNEEYNKYLLEIYGYKQEKIESLTMKSCRYYAIAILDADVHIGVIVFEGKEIAFLENGLQKKIDLYCRDHQGQLSKFVRDSLQFDKEVNVKQEGKSISIEEDILQIMEAGK
jgi:hypothetical protein